MKKNTLKKGMRGRKKTKAVGRILLLSKVKRTTNVGRG